MLVQSMTEEEIYGIGHSFGYYDYGQETGMSAAFSGKEATANYICAGCCGAVFYIPPASRARAISPLPRGTGWACR